jgi:hypothetical protein
MVVAGEQAHARTIAAGHKPKAIVLDFMNP